jgi:hypothetical protein
MKLERYTAVIQNVPFKTLPNTYHVLWYKNELRSWFFQV